MPFVDHYAVLGLDVGASDAAIRAAHKRQALACHPDRHPELADATVRMQRINAARHTLLDPARRATYDRVWRRHHRPSGMTALRAWVLALARQAAQRSSQRRRDRQDRDRARRDRVRARQDRARARRERRAQRASARRHKRTP